MTEENNNDEQEFRPEDMVPLVREYIGLSEDKKVIDKELKRCYMDYKKQKERLMEKRKPVETRFKELEKIIKKIIIKKDLPGVKYKNYIFTIEEKVVYKPPVDKIIETLERNPVEHFAHDKKTLAKMIVDAVKKKTRNTNPPRHFWIFVLIGYQ